MRVLPTLPALGYLVSGPLAGPWLFLVLGLLGSYANRRRFGTATNSLLDAIEPQQALSQDQRTNRGRQIRRRLG